MARDSQLVRITSTDVWNFALGIVQAHNASDPRERTDEARLLNCLAREHLRMATPPDGHFSRGGGAL